MAKPRSTKKKYSKPPLLPVAVSDFLWRRTFEGIGASFVAVAAALALALSTHDSGDPSWNTGTGVDQPISNWIGLPGAYISDFLLQTLGMASVFLPLTLALWGWHVIRYKSWMSRWRETLWLLTGLTLFASFLAFIPFSWNMNQHLGGTLGGSLGGMVFNHTAALMTPFIGFGGKIIAASFYFFVGFYALMRSFGFNREEWHYFIGNSFDRLANWKENRDQARLSREEEMDDQEDYRPAKRQINKISRAERTVVAPKAKPLKSSTRNDREKQTRLPFRDTGDFELPPLSLL